MMRADTLNMSRSERNQYYRAMGHMVRASGGTFCYQHGLVTEGCYGRGCTYPDLSVYVFGGLHKKEAP